MGRTTVYNQITDEDKISKMGLTINNSSFAPYFDEANLVIILKKIYKHTFK